MVTSGQTILFVARMATLACISTIARRNNLVITASAFAITDKRSSRTSSTHTNKNNIITPSFPKSLSPFSTTSFTGALQCSAVKSEELEIVASISHPAYDIVRKGLVKEYGAYCTVYKHKKTGAELLSAHNDDDNKVFGIVFRTPPTDSTGVPHILEHSVLCGSRKYRTKEPFVQLLQGSLQTFLNAFTYPDRTCYVLASQNEKDFNNLINVYADAVFHPRAISDPMVHAQEGWHLELEDKDDELTYKGVVYNEMKGVYSSPDSRLNRQAQRSLFPDNIYAVDSGGDPAVIPDLSFEQFKDFHSKYYHPSNSKIFFWGNDDVNGRLELMDEYLSEFDASPESKVGSMIHFQEKTITEPKWETHKYPVGADQPETHMVQVNWLINEKGLTPTEDLTMGVLDHLLMGTGQSVLYKTIIESGLGAAITGGGLSDELLQATFGVGLKGVKPEDNKKVEELVLKTLQTVAEEGFSDDEIASAINTIEFRLREFNTGSFPRGLSFMLGAMSKWIYDNEPTDALEFERPLQELKDTIKESGSDVFKKFINQYLVDNNHRVTIELVPSKTLEEEELEDEKKRLASIKESLSDDEIQDIIQKTSELKKFQAAEDAPEDRATIPSLELSDLQRDVTEYPCEVTKDENGSGVLVSRHKMQSTSGIAYINLSVDVSNVDYEDIVLLPLYTRIMTETGAGKYSDVELSQTIGTHTGGVGVNLLLTKLNPDGVSSGEIDNSGNLLTKINIKGKATSEKVGELLSIFTLILTEPNLDSKKKVLEMLKETKTRMESSIQGSGHSYANTRIKSRYSISGFISEKIGGLSYLDAIVSLIEEAENDWPTFLNRLKNIQDKLLASNTCRSGMILDITADNSVMDSTKSFVDSFLTTLPGDADGEDIQDFYNVEHPWAARARGEIAEEAPLKDEGFIVPTQVSYVGKGGKLFKDGERAPGSAAVVSRYLRTGYLWDHVRVIGGAYGGFCTFNPMEGDGVFTFLSYRDPNLDKTIDVYDAAADALVSAAKELEDNPEALATAIIGAVGDLDGALTAEQKGNKAFNRWILRQTAEERQRYRDEILNTKASDFLDFAMRLKNLSEPSLAVVSSKASFDSAAQAGKVMDMKTVV